ncbi:MAG TPA: hypothetical protein VF669_12935 [Tepidisphaeraceae bacterium]|jgi:hypothetical protein
MALFPPENAIGYSQFMLRGGWRKTLPLLGGYAAIVITAILLSVQFNPKYRRETLFGWTSGLLALQSAMLVLYGCSRTTASVRQDVTGKMIESHRLMPMPPAHAVAGYIMGSVSQGVMMALVTFCIGSVTAAGASVSFERWAMSNAVLLSFGMFLWCISCFIGFLPKGWAVVMWGMVAMPVVGEGGALQVLPGLSVMLSPVSGPSIFSMRGSYSLPWTYMIALAVQIYFGGICFIGAMRKYERPEAEALGVKLGLALLLGWVAISWVGIRQWEEFRPAWLRGHGTENAQVLASMIAAMLLAIAPISAAASALVWWRRHQVLNDPAPNPRPVPWLVVVASASALVLALTYAPLSPPTWHIEAVWRSTVVVVAFALSIFFLCRWMYRGMVRANFAIAFWLFLTWLLPLLVDLFRYAFSTDEDAPAISMISGFGPLGAMVLIWSRDFRLSNVGLIAQVVLAMVPLALDWMTTPRSKGMQVREAEGVA